MADFRDAGFGRGGVSGGGEQSKFESFMRRQQQQQQRQQQGRPRPQRQAAQPSRGGAGGGGGGGGPLSPRSESGMSYVSRMKHHNYSNVMDEMKGRGVGAGGGGGGGREPPAMGGGRSGQTRLATGHVRKPPQQQQQQWGFDAAFDDSFEDSGLNSSFATQHQQQRPHQRQRHPQQLQQRHSQQPQCRNPQGTYNGRGPSAPQSTLAGAAQRLTPPRGNRQVPATPISGGGGSDYGGGRRAASRGRRTYGGGNAPSNGGNGNQTPNNDDDAGGGPRARSSSRKAAPPTRTGRRLYADPSDSAKNRSRSTVRRAADRTRALAAAHQQHRSQRHNDDDCDNASVISSASSLGFGLYGSGGPSGTLSGSASGESFGGGHKPFPAPHVHGGYARQGTGSTARSDISNGSFGSRSSKGSLDALISRSRGSISGHVAAQDDNGSVASGTASVAARRRAKSRAAAAANTPGSRSHSVTPGGGHGGRGHGSRSLSTPPTAGRGSNAATAGTPRSIAPPAATPSSGAGSGAGDARSRMRRRMQSQSSPRTSFGSGASVGTPPQNSPPRVQAGGTPTQQRNSPPRPRRVDPNVPRRVRDPEPNPELQAHYRNLDMSSDAVDREVTSALDELKLSGMEVDFGAFGRPDSGSGSAGSGSFGGSFESGGNSGSTSGVRNANSNANAHANVHPSPGANAGNFNVFKGGNSQFKGGGRAGRTSPHTISTKSLTHTVDVQPSTSTSSHPSSSQRSSAAAHISPVISVEQHSESSSLTDDVGSDNWQLREAGTSGSGGGGGGGGSGWKPNMFKDPERTGSTFHKPKKIVRPGEGIPEGSVARTPPRGPEAREEERGLDPSSTTTTGTSKPPRSRSQPPPWHRPQPNGAQERRRGADPDGGGDGGEAAATDPPPWRKSQSKASRPAPLRTEPQEPPETSAATPVASASSVRDRISQFKGGPRGPAATPSSAASCATPRQSNSSSSKFRPGGNFEQDDGGETSSPYTPHAQQEPLRPKSLWTPRPRTGEESPAAPGDAAGGAAGGGLPPKAPPSSASSAGGSSGGGGGSDNPFAVKLRKTKPPPSPPEPIGSHSPRKEAESSSASSRPEARTHTHTDSKSPGLSHGAGTGIAPGGGGGGGTPFLGGVKLRKTGGGAPPPWAKARSDDDGGGGDDDDRRDVEAEPASELPSVPSAPTPEEPPKKKLTYREQQELLRRQREEEEAARAAEAAEAEAAAPKKLTYRERQELLKRQQREREGGAEGDAEEGRQSTKDVASLIRERIAVTKAHGPARPASTGNGAASDLAALRTNLKKTPGPTPPSFVAEAFPATTPPSLTVALARPPPAPPSPGPAAAPARAPPPLRTPPRAEDSDGEEGADPRAALSAMLKQRGATPPSATAPRSVEVEGDPKSSLNAMLQRRVAPSAADLEEDENDEGGDRGALAAMLAQRAPPRAPSRPPPPEVPAAAPADPRAALMASIARRAPAAAPAAADPRAALMAGIAKRGSGSGGAASEEERSPAAPPSGGGGDGRPALKDDPKYAKYFKMLKVGMPLPAVQHAMTRDGLDPSVMDGDHSAPVPEPKPPGGVPLKRDPAYAKYFKMLKLGLPMGAVKNAMERDGLDPAIMDRDHNQPASAQGGGADPSGSARKRQRDTHRRTRLHWDTTGSVKSNTFWALVEEDEELGQIEIDETEFTNLFQAEIKSTSVKVASGGKGGGSSRNVVQVIDPKRANNGGIILARLRMSYDDLAQAVDRIDETAMTANQAQGIIEYMPSSSERKSLRDYMRPAGDAGGESADVRFDRLCECEKFMVAMMTVKQSRRKLRALLFKLQFRACIHDLAHDVFSIEKACDELSHSVRLRKLFGIVLNIGNRLNTAGPGQKRKAGAFTIKSLLKLNQAKAFDNKTTFLHYVVLVVQRNSEGLLDFKEDLPTVSKAGKIYWDQCVSELEEVETQLENVRKLALHEAKSGKIVYHVPNKKGQPEEDRDSDDLSVESMSLEEEVALLRSTKIGMFALSAIRKVSQLRERVDTAKDKFSGLLEYFDERESKMQPHELFEIITAFCKDFDVARAEAEKMEKVRKREEKKDKEESSPGGPKKNEKLKSIQENQPISRQCQGEKSKKKSSPFLRASSMQPNMGSVLSDLKRATAPKTSPPVDGSSARTPRDSAPPVRGKSCPPPRVSPRSPRRHEDHDDTSYAPSDENFDTSQLHTKNTASHVTRRQQELPQHGESGSVNACTKSRALEEEAEARRAQARADELEAARAAKEAEAKRRAEEEAAAAEESERMAAEQRLREEEAAAARVRAEEAAAAKREAARIEMQHTPTLNGSISASSYETEVEGPTAGASGTKPTPKSHAAMSRRDILAARRARNRQFRESRSPGRAATQTPNATATPPVQPASNPPPVPSGEETRHESSAVTPRRPGQSGNATARASARDRYARHKKMLAAQRH